MKQQSETTETKTKRHTDFDQTSPEPMPEHWEREGRVGFNFLNLRSGKPHRIKITGYTPDRPNKKGDKNSFWQAIDLMSGEEGEIYIDGGLKGQFAVLGGPEKAVGNCYEITHKGMVEAFINGETQEVNSYDVFKLKTPKQ